MYRASVPVFVQYLTALSGVLAKGAEYATAKKIEPSVLVTARLRPDMFALARQVQIATDHAKGAAARLSGAEVPSFADTEASFEELQARIAKTLDFIQSVKPEAIDGTEDKDIVLKIQGKDYPFKGVDYLCNFALPNFFFHVTTAYAILRQAGEQIDKHDRQGGGSHGLKNPIMLRCPARPSRPTPCSHLSMTRRAAKHARRSKSPRTVPGRSADISAQRPC